MKTGNIGKTLIALGVFFWLYAFNMSIAISGSNIVNIHMISERQNMFLFGGLLFIGGIIIFAVAKLKQTDEEDVLEKLQQVQNKDKAKQLLDKATEKSERAAIELPKLLKQNFISFKGEWKPLAIRLLFGLLLGTVTNIFFPIMVRNLFNLNIDGWIFWLIIVYAFRNIRLVTILKHILIFNLSVVLTISIFLFIEGDVPSTAVYLILALLVAGLGSVFVVERKQIKK